MPSARLALLLLLLLATLFVAGCTAEPPRGESPEESTDPDDEGLSANVTAVDPEDEGNSTNQSGGRKA